MKFLYINIIYFLGTLGAFLYERDLSGYELNKEISALYFGIIIILFLIISYYSANADGKNKVSEFSSDSKIPIVLLYLSSLFVVFLALYFNTRYILVSYFILLLFIIHSSINKYINLVFVLVLILFLPPMERWVAGSLLVGLIFFFDLNYIKQNWFLFTLLIFFTFLSSYLKIESNIGLHPSLFISNDEFNSYENFNNSNNFTFLNGYENKKSNIIIRISDVVSHLSIMSHISNGGNILEHVNILEFYNKHVDPEKYIFSNVPYPDYEWGFFSILTLLLFDHRIEDFGLYFAVVLLTCISYMNFFMNRVGFFLYPIFLSMLFRGGFFGPVIFLMYISLLKVFLLRYRSAFPGNRPQEPKV
jgi:hypothetical protein